MVILFIQKRFILLIKRDYGRDKTKNSKCQSEMDNYAITLEIVPEDI